MSLNFPASPSNGDQYTSAGIIYTWDGEKWVTGGFSPTYVKTTGDTMTGDLTVPNINVPGTGVIDAMQTPKAILHFQAFADQSTTITASYNIASVVFQAAGIYRITFTNPLPGTAVISGMGSFGIATGGASFLYTSNGGQASWDIGTLTATGAGTLAQEGSQFYFLSWYSI